jgi:hypothetical protein
MTRLGFGLICGEVRISERILLLFGSERLDGDN